MRMLNDYCYYKDTKISLPLQTVLLLLLSSCFLTSTGFRQNYPREKRISTWIGMNSNSNNFANEADDDDDNRVSTINRRSILQAASNSAALFFLLSQPAMAAVEKKDVSTTAAEKQFIQNYPDFTQVMEDDGQTFWSYKDVKVGASGNSPKVGDRVVYEWSGYTIGYFGRPFEAKGGPQGGAFDKELDYSRSVLGKGTIIQGLEKAFLKDNMTVGTIRQVVIPYGPLSYPADDADHTKVGPKPSTFSGQRALNFVLDNPRVDRTLLFNIKLVRIDTPDKQGSFKRGK